MSTAPTPAPSPGLTRNEFFGGLAFLAVVLIAGLAGLAVLMRGPAPSPAPPNPIPADAQAYLLSEVAALRSVSAGVKSGAVKPDAASITAAIGAARKSANDKLAADVMAGDVPANLNAVADAMAGLIKGAR